VDVISNQSAPPARGGRLTCIDFLRGSAALGVVFLHSANKGQWLQTPEMTWAFGLLHQGRLGVPLFFVISGFCIHLRWAKRQAARLAADSADATTTNSLADRVLARRDAWKHEPTTTRSEFFSFWKRRMHRLYPPYLVTLCLSMGMVALVYWQSGRALSGTPAYPQPVWNWMLLDFVAHVTMLHGLHPELDYRGGNVVFWTLAREEYFYLLYFPLLAARRYFGLFKSLAAVFAAGLLVPWGMYHLLHALSLDAGTFKVAWYPFNNSTSAVALWIQWCLGMAAVESYYGLITLPTWCRRLWMAALWAAVASLCIYFKVYWLTPVLWGMTFFTLVNYCVAREHQGRWPVNGIARRVAGVGIFSYSLYLIHYPVLRVLQKVEITARQKLQLPESLAASPLYQLAVWAVLVVMAIGAGWVFFMLVERWFLNRESVPSGPGTRQAATSAEAAATEQIAP
jgi:peptidoglycan/LPS O-acetylase OafA/YrhL